MDPCNLKQRIFWASLHCSDVNKDLGFEAKAKDLGFKAKAEDLSFKAKAKDLSFKAKAKDLTQVLESRPRTWGSVLKDRQGPKTKAKDTSQGFRKFPGKFPETWKVSTAKFPESHLKNLENQKGRN